MRSLVANHVTLMFLYSVMTGVFFALLWREGIRERLRLFLMLFASLFVGGVLLAWIMLPFPVK